MLGAAICSRTGLAGGRRGPVDARGRLRLVDWTFWAAFVFGILPDLSSLGIYLLPVLLAGSSPSVHAIPGWIFILYRITHSLLGMGIIIGFLVWLHRPLWLPAMAWPLHVGLDILTHGNGVFLTPILWPFSDRHFIGWSWWLHPPIFYGSWIAAIVLWTVVIILRRSGRKQALHS